jgi:hypothetical protein
MDKELAFDILDEYVAKDSTGCVVEALQFIRKELAEVLKPSHDTASPKLLDELVSLLDSACFDDNVNEYRAYEIIEIVRRNHVE